MDEKCLIKATLTGGHSGYLTIKIHSLSQGNQFTAGSTCFVCTTAVKDSFITKYYRLGNSCSSSLRIFDSSPDGLVGPDEEPSFTYCGHEIASGTTFYSRDEHMLLQIVHGGASSKGFMGDYRFLSKDNYLIDGVEIAECSYRIEKTKGILYSPLYPFYYRSFVNCTYILPQRKGHRVVLSSGELHLGEEALLDIFETTNGGRGFVIEFTYEAAVWQSGSSEDVTGDCSLTVTSESEKIGSLSSAKLNLKGSNLPSKCRIVFQDRLLIAGYPNERVSVKFTHFNLYVPESKNITRRCADVDHLTADVRVGARLSRIDEWCGDWTPPQLMSSTNLLQLEYTTKSSRTLRESAKNDVGFRLDYKFHTDWDMQHMRARGDRDKGCRFVFNSSVQVSGKLWSVNYPGLYPRSLYCEYIFHGSDEQIVHIHFEYFDVEGFNQCDETTQSDFVLFSNYQTHDRTNRRFCGKVAPRGPILSESNYFRMIFSTNDIFDATGFYAHYQFITQRRQEEKLMQNQFGKEVPYRNRMTKWWTRFSRGGFNLEDNSRSGLPSSADDDKILCALERDPRSSLRSVEKATGALRVIVRRVLHQGEKVARRPRTVPHDLTQEQRRLRDNICASNLARMHWRKL
ncbi:unnamed protein product [Nippostrongylus brasiliensis]|uniref:Suppressor of lurcher protein 1 (inferred by orthology to a C. elegans protein) n=1 Tax=Nippostrongylus brasiliensis TaxID=27835 RepID=A0A0N4Y1T7_NIPBR|nr:unnamed protein product [Nippostrongylus brasiliensis]